jgi:hypothetical protein
MNFSVECTTMRSVLISIWAGLTLTASEMTGKSFYREGWQRTLPYTQYTASLRTGPV